MTWGLDPDEADPQYHDGHVVRSRAAAATISRRILAARRSRLVLDAGPLERLQSERTRVTGATRGRFGPVARPRVFVRHAEFEGAHVFDFENGTIARWTSYGDTARFNAALDG